MNQHQKGGPKGPVVWAMIGVVLAATYGCAIFSDPEREEARDRAYREALETRLQGYTYEMQCRALLPLAEELLWKNGYDEVDYRGQNMRLDTAWRDEGSERRSRHEVHARELGLDRCTVQILRRRESPEGIRQMRDIWLEVQLLESIDEDEASRIRSEARREAEEVVP